MRSMTRSKGRIRSVQALKEAAILYGLLFAIGGASFAASFFDGLNLCLVYNITGLPSPGCGMSRAFMSLPDIRLALTYHPLFFIIPFIPLAALLNERARNIAAVILIILFVGTWAVRMAVLFPHTPPMVYNENSLFEALRSVVNGRTF